MEPRAVVARYFEELWERRNFAAAALLIAEDCVTHQLRSADGPVPNTPRGPTAMREHIMVWTRGFPDLTVTVEASVADRDRVVSWLVFRGTHKGPWMGITATGRSIVVRSVVMHRIADGRIVEDWVLTDGLGVYQQLGLVDSTPTLIARGSGKGRTPA
ncbi:MAG TPA: ester cyclase [Gemmatimonadaceae bacterium]|nr:ester cyclase [Gemmatimonadaceae bacterium]